MNILSKILAILIPILLDYCLRRNQKSSSRNKHVNAAKKEKRALQDAISIAFDGTPVTKDQRKEVVNAARNLIPNY